MKLGQSYFIAAVCLALTWGTWAALPTDANILWTERGGISVKDWVEINDDYGTGQEGIVRILKQDDHEIVFCNDLVYMRKLWTLKDGTLKIKQEIWPVSQSGRTSELALKIRTLRSFEQFYTPYAFSSPAISGRWIKAGEMNKLECGYRGAYSNSMVYFVLYGGQHGFMVDRIQTNGYVMMSGGIREGAGDLSSFIFPIFGYGYFDWQFGHPAGPQGQESSWFDNLYPSEGGSCEYHVRFFESVSPDTITIKANTLATGARKELKNELFKGWEYHHQKPAKPIAFFAFVGDWGQEPRGGTGNLKTSGQHYYETLKRMRKILDENGQTDSQIYFWVMLYDQTPDNNAPYAGWGYFPLDAQDLKDFYEQLRTIHDIKLGVYVNFWVSSVKAPVYKEHPDWFSNQYIGVDSGGAGYAGKLPQWGDYLVSQMPALLKAYGLDFVFFDGANWAARWLGTNDQCRDFFVKISKVMHDNNAEFVANTDVPYVDIGMYEYDAGVDEKLDMAVASNLNNYTYHDYIFSPFYAWKTWEPNIIESSGQSIVQNFADKPGFIARWPVHFRGELNEHMLKDYFTPFVQRRAAAVKK